MNTKTIRAIFDDVNRERNVQDRKWGGKAHDYRNTLGDWVSYIVDHASRAPIGVGNFRPQMIRVAALAVAATESWDRSRYATHLKVKRMSRKFGGKRVST